MTQRVDVASLVDYAPLRCAIGDSDMESSQQLIHTIHLGQDPWAVEIPLVYTPYTQPGHIVVIGSDFGTPCAMVHPDVNVCEIPEQISLRFAIGVRTAKLCRKLMEIKACSKPGDQSQHSSES